MKGEILADFIIQRPEGYYCRYGDFFIDPLVPVDRAVISHAHADHARPGHRYIYCTAPTAAFMQHRYRRQHIGSFLEQSYRQPFLMQGVRLYFIPAGHMLGSAQLVMEYQGVRYVYTGDYKVQADDTCEALETIPADVLITESTFANPAVAHPDPVSEITKFSDVSANILLGAYALGKAQRLTGLINRHCPDKQILIHHSILPFHRIYESFGVSMGKYAPYSRKEMKAPPPNKIYIVPPLTFNSYFRATDVLRVFASGWKRLQQHNHMELYISDHVDWQDILAYVAATKSREIWTIHGDGQALASHFAGIIPVRPLRSPLCGAQP